MITSMAWVPKGAARTTPLRYELSAEERERVRQMAAQEVVSKKTGKDGEEQEHTASGHTFTQGGAMETDDATLEEFNLDDYDEDEEGQALHKINYEDADDGQMLLDVGDQAVAIGVDSEEEDDDADDNEIRPTDSLFVVAHTDDEDSHIEVQLYNEAEGSLYVHHDIYLPEFPLSVAWMDCPPYLNDGTQMTVGNYLAVGTFSPAIEIWNLDVLDPLEPSATLGGEATGKKKKKSGPQFAPGSHTDSVLGLSWNKSFRQALASASADKNVKIWDVTTQACSHTFQHHTDKVQNVLWHPTEGWLLASASFDKTVAMFDCRTGATALSARIGSDPESLAWNPNEPNHLYCSLEDGLVVCIDVRQAGANKGPINPLFSFRAHEETTSSVSFSTLVPGMMATSSVDQTVKVWDILAASKGSGSPHPVAYKTMNVGKIFAMNYSADVPYLLACGGDAGVVAVWESDELDVIRKYFSGREP
ncbi:unnamed protein product, partial [Ectocarpus fasciculatus]